ncbi:MAG: hypothetical protein U0414_00995 [Polyangiaceae bacterium]
MRGPLIGLAALAAVGCPGPTHGTGGEGGGSDAAAWRVIFDDGALDRAVLSVWGASASSVFAVGGPLGNSGLEALALRFDGKDWTDLHAGGAETFWWVHGLSAKDVWMVGEKGRIDHFDGTSFSHVTPLTNATLWGVMALAPGDVWAVGGTPEGDATEEDDVVLHFDGATWVRETLPDPPLHRALFKVWGRSDDDLFVVGEGGVIWHRTSAGWKLESDPPLTSGALFTVTGCGSSAWSVGGKDLLENDGAAGWKKVDVALTNGANGVACAPNGDLAIVGFGGLKRRRVGGAFLDDFTAPPHGDLHAVWADESGAFWAVGGDFVSKPKANAPRNGVIARFGPGKIGATLR